MIRRWHSHSASIALVVVVLLQTSCLHWAVRNDARAALAGPERPDRCRVTLSSGERLVLYEPVIERDSLFGRTAAADEAERRIALSSVRQLELHSSAAGAGVVVGAVVIGAAALFLTGLQRSF